MIHQALSPDGVDWLPPLILLRVWPVHWLSSSPKSVRSRDISPLPCSPTLVPHTLLIVYFFKELILFHRLP